MSNNNYFSIFREDTVKLCKSMVIKSQKTAEAINAHLSSMGYNPETETHKWKYFLNLAGEYHATDDTMFVTSLDTLEVIEFNKSTLELHKTTRKEYTLQSTYYEELVARYPEQEELIRGIINPVDIDKAVDADDHTILTWDSSLLESQETNLISELQEWVKGFAFRYFVDGYSLTDDFYTASFLGILYLNMPARVLNIRLANCHTEMVHSYHIWSYLASHSAMDDFREYLTHKQAHWLYRNIRYLEANVGKGEVFAELIQNFLTERGLSIYGHRIEHVVGEIMSGNNKPKPRIRRTPLNNKFAEEIERTVEDVLALEEPLGLWNPGHRFKDKDKITTGIEDSATDSLPTKVLESEAVDLSGSLPVTLGDTLLNHWIEWAASGRYATYINVSNPYTNNTMRLSSKDAVVAYFYCYNKAHGVTLTSMPDIHCERTVRTEAYIWTDIMRMLDASLVDEGEVAAIKSVMPNLELYTNTEDFYNACENIMGAVIYHRDLLGMIEDFNVYGEYGKAIDYCIRDYRATFNVPDISEWMIENGLALDTLSAGDAEIMANEILAAATGQDVNAGQSLRDLQTAMLAAMKRLCSYDLQFIQTTNEVELRRTDWPTIRGGNIRSKSYSKITMDPTLDRIEPVGIIRHHLHADDPLRMIDIAYNDQIQSRVSMDTGLDYTVAEQSNQITSGGSAPIRISNLEEL